MISLRNLAALGLLLPLGLGAGPGCAARPEATAPPAAALDAEGIEEVAEPDAVRAEGLREGARLASLYALTLHGVSMAMEGDRYYAAALASPENRERFRARADELIEQGRRLIDEVGPMIERGVEGASPETLSILAETHRLAQGVVATVAQRPDLATLPASPASAPGGALQPTPIQDEGGFAGQPVVADLLRSHLQMATGATLAVQGTQYWIASELSPAPDADAVERLAEHGREMRRTGAALVREAAPSPVGEVDPALQPVLAYTATLQDALRQLTDRLEEVQAPRIGTL